MELGGDVGHVDVVTPFVGRGTHGLVGDVHCLSGEGTAVGEQSRHDRGDGASDGVGVGRVDEAEHALLAMTRNTTVVRNGVGVVDCDIDCLGKENAR